MSNELLSSWVGRSEISIDTLPLTLVRRIAVTFGEECPRVGETLPPLWHWAFFQDPVIEELLGEDGHPERGIFLPPIDGRNRMWAGGRLVFDAPLKVGIEAERHSTITDIKEKQGKTGALLFVTVKHNYFQEGQLCISEEQDIVYREPSPPKLSHVAPLKKIEWIDTVCPSSVMLFRYSAVTFNGHRIHYDHPYVTEQEGYPGLVVHGPMLATLLLSSFLKNHSELTPRRFAFRGLRPMMAGHEFKLGGYRGEGKEYVLLAFNDQGIAHQAEIEYENKV